MSLNKGTVKAKDVEAINQEDVTTIKEALALGNVDNTSDADKPISTDTQNALNNKVDSVNTQTGDVVLPVLEGTQYIYVQANGTDTENATELQSAYNTAKTMSPSATKRITIVAGIGNYNFGTSVFVMDTQYIDLVSLDGNRSVIFNATLDSSSVATRTNGSINITANDVFVKGVDVLTKRFNIGDNLNLLKVENCKGGNTSFGFDGTASGTFTDCVGGSSSFSRFGTASGTFTNCVGGDDSFGNGGTASGTFTNCQSGDTSFGYLGIASGTFTNCVGGFRSFGNFGTLNGKLYRCQLTSSTFQTPSTGGKIVLGIDGNDDIVNLG